MQGIIYIHRNKINGKCYVGQTIQKPDTRWLEGDGYLGKNKDDTYMQPKFARAIIKYGWDNFEHLVLSDIYTNIDDLNAAEIATIAKYDSFNNGYNATSGGSHGKLSEETKRKISKAAKGRVVSEATREKISAANKGRTPWNKDKKTPEETLAKLRGRKHSEETIRKISETKKGHEVSEETKHKIGAGNKGRKHSEESKSKMSEKLKGKTPWNKGKKGQIPWNKGKKLSEETRKKMREAAKDRKVKDYETR